MAKLAKNIIDFCGARGLCAAYVLAVFIVLVIELMLGVLGEKVPVLFITLSGVLVLAADVGILFILFKKRKIKEGEPIDDLAEELIRKNPELILITDEIGYGIVPVDRMEREYREQTGRVCTRLAAYSEKVYRVMCGIGQVIKEV